MRRRTLLGMVAAVSCLLSGCNLSQLHYTNDHRLTFESPAARSRVVTPLTIRWTMRGFNPVGLDGSRSEGRGVFAVFVDRAPMPVGQGLKWLAKDDRGCRRDPRCPDADYLSRQGVVLTTGTQVSLDVLPLATDGVGDEQHYVNVVLLDGTGRRIGESAWYLPFSSKRRAGR